MYWRPLDRKTTKRITKLKTKASKYEYKLVFCGKQINPRERKIELSADDLIKNDSVFISNPNYKISKLEFSGFADSNEIEKKYKSNILNAEIKEILSLEQKEITCKIYIEHKDVKTEIVEITIR